MADQDPLPDSTFDDVRPSPPGPTARRIALVLLLLVVLAGAAGLLGVRSGTASASAEGYTLTVDYARVARAGLDVPWRATVHHPGGFSGQLTIAVSAHYFDIFETQGYNPAPAGETSSDELRYLTFDPPPGDTFELTYDAYIQPASQLGRSAETALLIGDREIVRVDYRTWLVP